jgi:two-component system phosphate regulon sensor histidine kinase PhoR
MPAGRRRSFYDVYRRNTERLHQLVESLLDFARMEAGRKAYDRQPIDAVALTTHVVAEFQRHAPVGSARIELETAAASGLQIHGDRDALVNALWNLLDNAVKYSPDGGPIHVSVGPHPLGTVIAVKDSGLGIARHERDAIFQRFVRGKQAVDLGIKGTGLGLAMVAHIARAHDGDVEVESDEGQGSTFRLALPAAVHATEGAPRYEPA